MPYQKSRSFHHLSTQAKKGVQFSRVRPSISDPQPKAPTFKPPAPPDLDPKRAVSPTISATTPKRSHGRSTPRLPLPKLPQVLRIALYSSKRERCGIATYTTQLENSLALLGHQIGHWASDFPYIKSLNEIRAWKPDVFHIQHEMSIMPPPETLVRIAAHLRNRGTLNAITLHGESYQTILMAQKIGKVIVHRPSHFFPGATVIPMPCTTAPAVLDRALFRSRYGIPNEAFLISTIGFLIPWKEHSKILQALAPWLRARPDVHLQIIASDHFSPSTKAYARACKAEIASVSAELPGRIHAVHNYPSDQEIIERLAASDLGYTWCPFDTGSSSAAAAQFTSARCPLVASDSTHYEGLGTGIIRASKSSLSDFVRLIIETASNPYQLETLRKNQWQTYHERNYLETARRHVLVYREASDGGQF